MSDPSSNYNPSNSMRKQDLEDEIEYITLYVRRDQFPKAQEQLAKLNNDELQQIDIELYNKKITLEGICLNKSGKFPEAIELTEPAYKYFSDKVDPAWIILSAVPYTDSLWKTGKLKESMDLIKIVEPFFDKIPTRGVPGANFFYFKEKRAELTNIKGIITWQLGEIHNSQNHFQQALEQYQELNQERKIAMLLNNLGNIYTYKGELSTALEHYEKALKIRKDLDDKRGLSSTLGNMAEVFQVQGRLEEAYEKAIECKTLFEELGQTQMLAHAYFIIISILINDNREHEGQTFLQELKLLDPEGENTFINLQKIISEAIILKHKSRLLDIFEGGLLFRKVMSEKIIDFSMYMLASLYYSEVLLLELRLSDNEQVFEEVKVIIQALKYKAMQQQTASVLIQSNLLLAQIKLVDFQINEAQSILHEVIELAEDKKLSRFAVAASLELDRLTNNSSKWQELMSKNAPIRERLELTNLEKILESIIQKRDTQVPDVEPEDPVIFMIMVESGLSVYSQSFEKQMADEQLIAGFLNAINMFGQQIFEGQETIERIKYGQFTLLLKKTGALTFCYVFKGQSYFAKKRLDTFVKRLQEVKLLRLQMNSNQDVIAISDEEEAEIRDIVTSVFKEMGK